jgi:hypothetical protein
MVSPHNRECDLHEYALWQASLNVVHSSFAVRFFLETSVTVSFEKNLCTFSSASVLSPICKKQEKTSKHKVPSLSLSFTSVKRSVITLRDVICRGFP